MGKKKEWKKPTNLAPIHFGDCPECGAEVFEGQTIWLLGEDWVCYDCIQPITNPAGHYHPAGWFMEMQDVS